MNARTSNKFSTGRGMGVWAPASFSVPSPTVIARGMGVWSPGSFSVPSPTVRVGVRTPGMGVWAPASFSVPSPTVRPIGRGMGAWASVYDTIGYPIETPGVRLGAAINRAMNQAQVALAAGTPGQTPIMPGDQPGFSGMGMGMGMGMGVWNRAAFPVPSPVVKIGRGVRTGCGCGCNGAGACGGGMGSLAEYVPDLGETYGINNWVLLAGGAVLAYTLLGRGSNYRQEVREAKDQYRRKVTKAKRTYRRGYRQIYDAVAER